MPYTCASIKSGNNHIDTMRFALKTHFPIAHRFVHCRQLLNRTDLDSQRDNLTDSPNPNWLRRFFRANMLNRADLIHKPFLCDLLHRLKEKLSKCHQITHILQTPRRLSLGKYIYLDFSNSNRAHGRLERLVQSLDVPSCVFRNRKIFLRSRSD